MCTRVTTLRNDTGVTLRSVPALNVAEPQPALWVSVDFIILNSIDAPQSLMRSHLLTDAAIHGKFVFIAASLCPARRKGPARAGRVAGTRPRRPRQSVPLREGALFGSRARESPFRESSVSESPARESLRVVNP